MQVTSHHYCTSVQERPADSSALNIVEALFPRLSDPHLAQPKLSSALTTLEIEQLRSTLGALFTFDPRYPTGPYNLDLSQRHDLELWDKVMQADAENRAQRRAAKLKDTGQHGQWSMVRNLVVNRKPVIYQTGYIPPHHAAVEFDVFSTRHIGNIPHSDIDKLGTTVRELVAELDGRDRLMEVTAQYGPRLGRRQQSKYTYAQHPIADDNDAVMPRTQARKRVRECVCTCRPASMGSSNGRARVEAEESMCATCAHTCAGLRWQGKMDKLRHVLVIMTFLIITISQ